MMRLCVVFAAVVSAAAVFAKLPFMPELAPQPSAAVEPPGYSNKLELACAAARKCATYTNLTDLSQSDREKLMRGWVKVFETNGVPKEYRMGRHVAPVVADPPHRGVKNEEAIDDVHRRKQAAGRWELQTCPERSSSR